MNRATFSLALTLGAALAASLPSAQSVVLTSSKDNTLIEDPAGAFSNGAGPVMFSGRVATAPTIRRAVLAFDVAGSVPAGSTIDSVTLTLTINMVNNTTARDLDLHVLSADWGEGTSSATGGSGAASTTNDATWLHTFFNTSLWTAAGGDFAAGSSATTSVGNVGTYFWSSAQMAADVQSWLDAPASNFGWILVGDETTLQTVKRAATREDPNAAVRPQLTIHYTAPCPGAAFAIRNGGSNPVTYFTTGAVLGGTFSAGVDNNVAGETTSVLFAFDTAVSVTLAGGQTLLCADLGGNGELFTGAGLAPTSSVGGVDSYSLAVPDLPSLCGLELRSQAIQFGVPPFKLSNAQDLTVGS